MQRLALLAKDGKVAKAPSSKPSLCKLDFLLKVGGSKKSRSPPRKRESTSTVNRDQLRFKSKAKSRVSWDEKSLDEAAFARHQS